MSVYGSISSCSGKTLIFFIRNMLSVFLDISFGKSKVDDIHFVCSLADANYEIIRFDISVEEMP
jgi:hypothetical protein